MSMFQTMEIAQMTWKMMINSEHLHTVSESLRQTYNNRKKDYEK